MRASASILLLLAGVAAAGCQSCCRDFGEREKWTASGYLGRSHTFNSDIRVDQPALGSDFTVRDVSFDDKSFTASPPPNYGLRLTRWVGACRTHGIQIDFQHAKAIARTNEVKTIDGVKNGQPIPSPAPMNSVIQRWRVSFGHNMLTANYVKRWFPKGKRDRTLWGRIQPYAGAGVGIAIPSPAIEIDGNHTADYRYAGPVAVGMVGANLDVWRRWSVFLEGKASYADLSIDLINGGRSTTELWTVNVLGGLSFRF